MGTDQDFEHGATPAAQDVVTGQGIGAADEGSPASPPSDAGAAAAGGLGSLVSGVVKDLQGLLRGELQLAKTELKQEATTAAGGAAAITAGGVAGLIGFVFVMHGVADLLSKVMPRWAANGLVGLAMAGTGAALGLSGKQKLSTANLTPTQTIQSLREDTAWAKEQLGSAGGV